MKKSLLLAALFIGGCSFTHVAAIRTYEPVEESDVRILFKEMPSCDYEEIALINTPYMWRSSSAVKDARAKAAKIGADYVKIESVQTNEDNDAKVEAVAYKCMR